MIGFRLRPPHVIATVRVGAGPVPTEKYADKNGVVWQLWDYCPAGTTIADCDWENSFRATQAGYDDVEDEFSGLSYSPAFGSDSYDGLKAKIVAFAASHSPSKDTGVSDSGDTVRPPKPSSTPGYAPPKSTTKTPPLTTKASAPGGDNNLVVFVLLGAVGAGLIAMKLLA